MQKNVAGQKWTVFAFDRTTLIPKSGDASNITAKISKDDAALTGTNDTNPTETEAGFYSFDLLQAETNADKLLIVPTSVTSNIQVLGVPAEIVTVPIGYSDASNLDVINSGEANWLTATGFNTVTPPTVAEFNARTIPSGDYFDSSVDVVANVTLVDTTTANTDMRGTDSAATAASLAIAQSGIDEIELDTGTTLPATLATIAGYIDTEIAAIKAKTDNLPADPATETTLAVLDGLIDSIKAATDQLTFTTTNKLDTRVDYVGTNAVTTPNDFKATGFSTHSAANVASLVLDDPSNLLLVNESGYVTTSNPAAGSGSAHTAADVANLILETPANKLVTDASGYVTAENMRGTDGANTVTPDAAGTAATLHSTTDSLVQSRTLPSGDYFDYSVDTVNADLTGIATSTNVTEARDVIIATGEANWVTGSGGGSISAESVWTYAGRTLTSAANITSDSGVINTTSGAIDTVTVNSDMRGTDGANTTTPDPSGSIDAIKGATWSSSTDTLEDIRNAISDISTGTGTGARSVMIQVNDGTDPIQNAKVRLSLNAESYLSSTDVSGDTSAFGLENDGTWNIIISAAGYQSQVTTLAVAADIGSGEQIYSLTENIVTAPDDPSLCRVAAYVQLNGDSEEGATFKALLSGRNLTTEGIVVNQEVSSTTNSSGYAYLDLIREDQFVDGSGIYELNLINSRGRLIFRTSSAIPNSGVANLEDLI